MQIALVCFCDFGHRVRVMLSTTNVTTGERARGAHASDVDARDRVREGDDDGPGARVHASSSVRRWW